MAAPRELAKPPITEALVDIRIVADTVVTVAHLAPLRGELRETFPKEDERRHMSGEFRFEAGKLLPPTSRDLGFHGLWLTSADGTRVVQFRTNGFTFNNVGLGHYMGGEALIDEALRLWSRYAEVVQPSAVIRVGLRYLNRLDLPLQTGEEFQTYLTSPPELPEDAPQKVSNFLSRIVAHDETGALAIVTQKLDMGTDQLQAVLIDLDVAFLLEDGIPPTAEAIRPFVGVLRDLKNRTFFALLTEKTVKRFL
jgi:uncharacterized protein (TIGR04255 family)